MCFARRSAVCSATWSTSPSEQAARGHEVGVFFDSGGALRACRRTPWRAFPAASRSASGLCPIHRNPGVHDVVAFARFLRVASRRPGRTSCTATARRAASMRDCPAAERNAGGADPRLYAARRQLQLSPRLVRRIASTWRSSACSAVRPTCSCSRAPISPAASTRYVGDRAGCAPDCRQRPRRRRIRSRRARRRRRRPPLCRRIARGQGHRHAARGARRWWRALAARRPARSLVGSGPDQAILIGAGAAARRRRSRDLPRPDAGSPGFQARTNPGRALAGRIAALRRAGSGGAHVPMVATDVGGIPEIFGPFVGSPRPLRRSGESRRPHRRDAATSRPSCVGGRRRIWQPMSPPISISNRWSMPCMAGYREALSKRARSACRRRLRPSNPRCELAMALFSADQLRSVDRGDAPRQERVAVPTPRCSTSSPPRPRGPPILAWSWSARCAESNLRCCC